MRIVLFFIALAMANATLAGTLETCRQKEKDKEGVRTCVRAELARSLNKLHEITKAAQAAVSQNTRETGRKNILREYRALQAQHVRARNATCHRRLSGIDLVACEADMNFAQVEKLARFTE